MKQKTNSTRWIVISVVAVVILIILGVMMFGNRTPKDLDSFAKCITARGAKMYGAYWCPHCNKQKEMFGSSVQYINYTECSLANAEGETAECTAAGISVYPTWVFKDGSRVEGEVSFNDLSGYTGCRMN